MLTAQQKQHIEEKVVSLLAEVDKKFGTKITIPKIDYNLRGTTAGLADYQNWRLCFHPILAYENWNKYIARTVPHEVAHLAVDVLYPHVHRGSRRNPHGVEWQSIMTMFGADISRCHSYDVSSVYRKQKRYQYQCQQCGTHLDLSGKVNAMIGKGQVYFHNLCGKKGILVPVVS